MLSIKEKATRAEANDQRREAFPLKSVRQPAAALISWTDMVIANFGRELHALKIDQEEREFFATDHGCVYDCGNEEILTISRIEFDAD
jgi:hypothetical protein